MALRIDRLLTVSIAALLTTGCSLNVFGGRDRAPPPTPLVAAPAGTVTGATLPPPEGGVAGQAPSGLAALDPNATAVTASTSGANAVAPVSPAADSGEVGRTDLLGGWTINAAGESCQLFMTLTTWAGGYRASTRNCTNATFQGISAWNVEGGQIQLLNDAGTTIARLYPASKSELNGQSAGGAPISVTR